MSDDIEKPHEDRHVWAWEWLRDNQIQADADGTLVSVSRQALCETLDELERAHLNEAHLKTRLADAERARDLHHARAERFRARVLAAQEALNP